MAGSSWLRTSRESSLPSRGVLSSLGGRNSSHPGGGRCPHGHTGRTGHSQLPSVLEGMAGSNWGLSSRPGSSRSRPRGGRRSGWHTCRAHSVCHSGQAGRTSGRRALGIQGRTRNCRSPGGRYPRSCRCSSYCSRLPRGRQGRAGGSGPPSSRPGTGSVHEQGRSHQSGHSHSGWHSLCQTAPSGRGAGSALRATQGCRCRLRFGGCKLPRGHTGSWRCNRSPRFQASRARSSYHAANPPCTRRRRPPASRRWRCRRSSARCSRLHRCRGGRGWRSAGPCSRAHSGTGRCRAGTRRRGGRGSAPGSRARACPAGSSRCSAGRPSPAGTSTPRSSGGS